MLKIVEIKLINLFVWPNAAVLFCAIFTVD